VDWIGGCCFAYPSGYYWGPGSAVTNYTYFSNVNYIHNTYNSNNSARYVAARVTRSAQNYARPAYQPTQGYNPNFQAQRPTFTASQQRPTFASSYAAPQRSFTPTSYSQPTYSAPRQTQSYSAPQRSYSGPARSYSAPASHSSGGSNKHSR
jgi:hypothetical protein